MTRRVVGSKILCRISIFKDCPAFIPEPKYKTGQSLNKVL